MKHILFTITLFIGLLSCKAQSPIIAIEDRTPPYNEGVYYKDINGVFDPFIGTWIWQDGNSSITIEIVKIEMEHREGHKINEYRDNLYGQIKYIENGVEIFNTLNSVEYALINMRGTPTNNWLGFRFKDPLLPKKGHIDFDLLDDNTQATFRLRNTEGSRIYLDGETHEDPEFSMPRRVEYILTKQ